VTLTVGDTTDQIEWHLPTYDPRNEKIYHYKLHSLDVYFWTPKDALAFLSGARRLLPPAQVEVHDEPAPPPQPVPRQQPEASGLVRRLEQAAIADSSFAARPAAADVPTFAPPPLSAVSATAAEPAAFAPMAYNPAAPAAPESVRHREKTPPPDDGGVDPLAAAVARDYGQQPFSPGFGPPGGMTSPGFPPPQFQHPGLVRAATMPHGGLTSPGLASPGFASPGLASPYGAAFPGSPGFAPPPPPPPAGVPAAAGVPQQLAKAPGQTPTPPITSPGLPPPPPSSGYSTYPSYSSQQQQQAPAQAGQAPANHGYGIHQQMYRPAEGETAVKYAPKPEGRGKLEESAGRLERGLTRGLKRFEKKFG
jgi:hypothetical protein